MRVVPAFIFFHFLTMVSPTNARNSDFHDKHGCQGKRLYLDCPRNYILEILSANYGRTNKYRCTGANKAINETHCISKTAQKIIKDKCDNKRTCSVLASSSELGEDPCPRVLKYVDVIYLCVPHTRSTPGTPQPRGHIRSTIGRSERLTSVVSTALEVREVFTTTQEIVEPSKTDKEPKMIKKKRDHGFFQSLLVLLVIAKDKPRHSMLSVLTGIAAGTVIILVTVLACLCLEKKRRKGGDKTFHDSNEKRVEVVEVQEDKLLDRKSGRNSDSVQSTRTDDHVDSAFGDDEPVRRESNDYEMAQDMAYLDSYLDEYNANKSLPRPPGRSNSRGSGFLRMSRRAHNDGSKGRYYDYNSQDQSFTTFS